jgi:cytochrome P450
MVRSLWLTHEVAAFKFVSRAMTHDEKKYPEPETFRPERFLTPEGKLNDDETVLTYGFGRR